MIVFLNKFGTTLASRQAGKEAYLAFQPVLASLDDQETLEVDFSDVVTFSPSWADEFLSPLHERFGQRMKLRPSDNASVKLTVDMLEQIHGFEFAMSGDGA